MKAIVVTDQAAGTAGAKLVERPEPQAAINDVLVQIHASGFTGDELTWPSTWTDHAGRDRTPSIPGHELAGVVTALGYGTMTKPGAKCQAFVLFYLLRRVTRGRPTRANACQVLSA